MYSVTFNTSAFKPIEMTLGEVPLGPVSLVQIDTPPLCLETEEYEVTIKLRIVGKEKYREIVRTMQQIS